jgi:hypothetical protein
MGHPDIRTTYNLYGHLFPDREEELVARLDSRYDRAARSPEVPVQGQGQEIDFELALSSRLFRSPRGSRQDERRPDRGKRSVGPSGCYSNRLGELRRLKADLQCEAKRLVQFDDLVRPQHPDR